MKPTVRLVLKTSITEGAIPFAASNPLRVIPPLFISSGVAGTFMGAFLLMISLNLGKKKEN